MIPRDKIALALDVSSAGEALSLVQKTSDSVGVYKIGMQLFYAEGPDLVRRIKDQGRKVFLDLKLHDIPNTVASAVRSVTPLGVDFLTLHGSGGSAMLRAAAEVAGDMRLLAVTVLTSMNAAEMRAVGIEDSPADQVLRLARMAKEAGVGGVVCSPHEASLLRSAMGRDTFLVCPGIRPSGSAKDDQKRTATPSQAFADGANLLVIGRPIRAAQDPGAAARHLLESLV
jgi:orotidine-5'-phosphate decarboxylase